MKSTHVDLLLSRPLFAAALAVAAACAQAHDTWVMPNSFQGPAGKPVLATMSAGDGLKALSVPHRDRLRSLDIIDVNGRQTYTAWKSRKTLAELRFAAPAAGVSCLAVSTKDRDIEIVPKLVDDYLAEIQPGAEITERWSQQRARGEVWKERYAKDGKTYLRRGDADAGWPQLAVLGQTLEIVPTQDPTRLKKGDRIDVVLQHQGKPLADVALRLFSGKSDEKLVRTDAQGRASFEVVNGGKQLIATTMLNIPERDGAPWTSRFATMGFGVPD